MASVIALRSTPAFVFVVHKSRYETKWNDGQEMLYPTGRIVETPL